MITEHPPSQYTHQAQRRTQPLPLPHLALQTACRHSPHMTQNDAHTKLYTIASKAPGPNHACRSYAIHRHLLHTKPGLSSPSSRWGQVHRGKHMRAATATHTLQAQGRIQPSPCRTRPYKQLAYTRHTIDYATAAHTQTHRTVHTPSYTQPAADVY